MTYQLRRELTATTNAWKLTLDTGLELVVAPGWEREDTVLLLADELVREYTAADEMVDALKGFPAGVAS